MGVSYVMVAGNVNSFWRGWRAKALDDEMLRLICEDSIPKPAIVRQVNSVRVAEGDPILL